MLGERGGAPLHFLLAWVVAHTGGGLIALRLVSALFAVASVPLIALLVARLAGRAVGARRDRARRRRAGCCSSTASTAGCTRSSSSRRRSRTSRCCGRSSRGGAGWIALGARDARVHRDATRTARSCSRRRGSTSCSCGDAFARGGRRRSPRSVVLAHPVLAQRHRAREPLRRRRRRRRDEARQPARDPRATSRDVAGDFTVGWLAVRVVVLLLAASAGSCCSRVRTGAARVFVACVARDAVPRSSLLARIGSGSASPESRHLIFVLPFFALLVALPLVAHRAARLRRRRRGRARSSRSAPARSRGACTRRRTLYVGEAPSARVARARRRRPWLAATSRPDDVLFGYDPLFLGAWEQDRRRLAHRRPARRHEARAAACSTARRSRSAAASGCSTPSDNNNFTCTAAAHPAALPASGVASSRRACSGRSSCIRSRKPTRTIRRVPAPDAGAGEARRQVALHRRLRHQLPDGRARRRTRGSTRAARAS